MKSKVVTIVCCILIILAIICFGYIFLNSNEKEEENNNISTEQEVEENNEVVEREERAKNVVVNSRIGNQLTEHIKYSNIYSNRIIEELDENGLSDKAKLLIALDKLYRNDDYQSLMSYPEDYSATYITGENMQKILDDTFYNSNTNFMSIEESLEYDNSNNLFTLVHIGYEGASFNYTLEIPYQILQYSDRIELQAYRVYITKNVQMQEITSNISNNLYYDKSKSLPAITLNDEVLGMESEQIEYIRGLIEDGTLDKNKLESVQYTFKNNNDIYKLDGFKKI